MGRPDRVLLVEAGPGRGTLMRDALRAIRQTTPAFAQALSVRLVETSPRLRALQRDAVPDALWHDSLDDVPEGPLLLLANEFLDALPIRQFVRSGDGWSERHVVDGAFVLERSRESFRAEGEGEIVERGEAAEAFCAAVAGRIARHNGAALFIDYGAQEGSSGDSLQALRDRAFADPLQGPGSADLTAHVDFSALARAAGAAGAAVHGPVPQGLFLARLGLFQRTDRLARGKTPSEVHALVEAAQRLAEPMAMGRLFKAMAVAYPSLPQPAGFAA